MGDYAHQYRLVGDYAQQYRLAQGNGGLRTAPEGIVAAARTTAAQISDGRKPPPTFFITLSDKRGVAASVCGSVWLWRRGGDRARPIDNYNNYYY